MEDSVNNEAETPAVPGEAPAETANSVVGENSAITPSAPPTLTPVAQSSSQPVPVIMQKQPAEAGPTTVNVPPKQEAPPASPIVQNAAVPTPGSASPAPAQAKPAELPRPASQPEPVSTTSAAQSETAPPANTLSNDAILASPTPVDNDPPPLVDVPPLSAVAPATGGATTLTALDPAANPDSHLPPPRPQANPPAQIPPQESKDVPTLQPVAEQPSQPKPAPQTAAKPRMEAEPPPKPISKPEPIDVVQPTPTAESETGPPPMKIDPLPKPEPYAETGAKIAAPAEAKPGDESNTVENKDLKSASSPEVAPVSLKPLPAAAAEGLTLSRNEMEVPLPESEDSGDETEQKAVEAEKEPAAKAEALPLKVEKEQEAAPSESGPKLPVLLAPTPGKNPPTVEAVKSDQNDSAKKPHTKSVPTPKKADSIDDIIQELTSKTTLKAPTEKGSRKKGESKLENYVKNEFFVSEGAEDPWILPAAAAAGVAANHKRKSARDSSKAGAWGMFTSIFFFGSVLLLGSLAIAWMMRGTIASKIEEKANQKVEEAGYFIDYSEWNYDPVRGIVLSNVTVFESEAKAIPYAKIDNIGLNADFLAILRTRDVAGLKKTVSFRDSNLILFDQNQVVANLTHLRGTMELRPGLVDLDSLKGRIEGVRFDVGGAIRFPETEEKEVALWAAKPETSSIATSEPGTGSIIIQDNVEVELDPTSEDSKPSKSEMLRPSFAPRDDITAPRAIPVFPEESTTPEKTETPVETIEEPTPQVEPPVISPPQIAPPPIAPPPIAPPAMEPGEDETATGEETADPSLTSSSEPLSPNAADSSVKKSEGLPSLAFLGDVIPLFRVKSEGPSPMLTSRFDVDLNPGTEKILADGRLTGSQITFRKSVLEGIPFHSIDVPYSYDHSEGILALPELSIGYDEGKLTGNIGVHLKKKLLNLQNVRSTIDLLAFISRIKPDLEESFKSFRLLDAPEIFIPQGQMPLENPMAGQLDFTYEQWAGLVWTIGGKNLPVREIRGSGKLSNSLLSLDALHAKVLDGPTFVEGSMRLAKPDYPFNGSINVRAMPMASLAKFAGIEGKYLNGLLNLDYQGSITSSLAKMGGTGAVELKDGQLFKVPVIGPIQRLLGAAIPVFGPKNNSTMTGNYIIDSGILMTSDLLIRSDGTKVAVNGQADLTQLMTNFTATANLDGPLGVATGLTGEKIEIEGRGPLQSPVIRLKGGALPAGFSSETVKGILGIADGSNEALSAMMQEIAGGSASAMGTLLKGVGGENNRVKSGVDAATEVLRGVVVPGATPVPVPKPPAESKAPSGSRAGDILNSVRKSQEGLQGILQKTR